MKKIFLSIIIGALTFSVFIGILFILFGAVDPHLFKLFITMIIIIAFSFISLKCSELYDIQKYSQLSIIGMTLAAIGTIYSTLMLWEIIAVEPFTTRLLLTIIYSNIANMWISKIILKEDLNSMAFKIKLATIISIIILTLLTLIIVWFNNLGNAMDPIYRLLWVFLLLSILGSIVIPLINKINKHN